MSPSAHNVGVGGFSHTFNTLPQPTFTSPYIVIVPGISGLMIGGVWVPNTVPADPSLCPVVAATPVPTPVPTAVPIVAPPVVPQAVQNPAVGGIFTGPRSTPAVPRAMPAAGTVPVPGVPALRPPSTGDAGLLPVDGF